MESVRGQTALKQVSRPSENGTAHCSIMVGQPLRLNSFPASRIKILVVEHWQGRASVRLAGVIRPLYV